MMEKLISIFLILSLGSCFTKKPIDYDELKNISDLNSRLISDFYENVLDTIFQDDHILNEPIKELGKIPNELCLSSTKIKHDPFDSYDYFDEKFVNDQLKKFQAFQWTRVLSKKRVLSRKIENSLNENIDEGWTKFRDDGNKGCICSLSIPIFSDDFKKVFVEIGVQCAPEIGFGEILVFKWINNKWTLFQKCPTWMS